MALSARSAHSEQDLVDIIRLIRSRRVGPGTFHRLIDEHGSVGSALAALPDVAGAAGVKDYAPCPPEDALAEIAAARKCGAVPLVHGEQDYPAGFAELADPPPIIWAIGRLDLVKRPSISVVGARNASSLGLRMARSLAAGCGKAGLTIVSGLARGIDAVAHEAALPTGTVAIMAGGVDVLYPRDNEHLARSIGRDGLRLSEHPPGLVPQSRHFPQRNRLISGLSRATIVVEAATKSGSLITARAALDQGRDVMAVPGHPFDARSAGCNALIRDGAALIRNVADVLEALGDLPGDADRPDAAEPAPELQERPRPVPVPAPGKLQSAILSLIGAAPLLEEQVIRDLGLPQRIVTPAIVTLEIEGRIRRRPGGYLCPT